jgi:hypothetical protein
MEFPEGGRSEWTPLPGVDLRCKDLPDFGSMSDEEYRTWWNERIQGSRSTRTMLSLIIQRFRLQRIKTSNVEYFMMCWDLRKRRPEVRAVLDPLLAWYLCSAKSKEERTANNAG